MILNELLKVLPQEAQLNIYDDIAETGGTCDFIGTPATMLERYQNRDIRMVNIASEKTLNIFLKRIGNTLDILPN